MMGNARESIGERIARLRGKASQEAFADRCKISRRTLQNIESGDTGSPGIDKLGKIADALGVTVDYLRGKEGPPKTRPSPEDMRALIGQDGATIPWGPVSHVLEGFLNAKPVRRAGVLATLYDDPSILSDFLRAEGRTKER